MTAAECKDIDSEGWLKQKLYKAEKVQKINRKGQRTYQTRSQRKHRLRERNSISARQKNPMALGACKVPLTGNNVNFHFTRIHTSNFVCVHIQ